MDSLKELETIFDYLKKVGIKKDYFIFAPYIARGLAYYTGPVWEFEILEGDIGSVCGAGRYDNTIGKFIGRRVPATGGSFGIERIVEVIKDRKMVKIRSTPSKVLVTYFDQATFPNSLSVANDLRKNEIKTMLYPEPAKLAKQLKYAVRKGIPYVIIVGPDEAKKNVVKLKNMKTREQKELSIEELVNSLIR